MLQTILTTALTVAVSLIVTLVFNNFVNGTKKAKQRKEQELREIIRQVVRDELQEIRVDNKLIKRGLQHVLKNELKIRYEHWFDQGYAPIDAKDDLERMYQVYHSLGANGVMDSHRNRFLQLSDYPPDEN